MTTAGNHQTSNIQKNNIASAVAVVLFIASFIYLSVELSRNNNLKENLIHERLTSEVGLSEKLLLEKDLAKIRTELRESKRENSQLHQDLSVTTAKLKIADAAPEGSHDQTIVVRTLRKQIENLSNQNLDRDQEIVRYRISVTQLEELNDDFASTVNSLQQQNKELREELEALRLVTMNATLTESTNRNGKLTVKARKTRNLIVNVDVPLTAENLVFKITNPLGQELTDKEGFLSVISVSGKNSPLGPFYATTSSIPALDYNSIQMTYVARDKLEPGKYKIDIFNNSMSIGSLRLRLR